MFGMITKTVGRLCLVAVAVGVAAGATGKDKIHDVIDRVMTPDDSSAVTDPAKPAPADATTLIDTVREEQAKERDKIAALKADCNRQQREFETEDGKLAELKQERSQIGPYIARLDALIAGGETSFPIGNRSVTRSALITERDEKARRATELQHTIGSSQSGLEERKKILTETDKQLKECEDRLAQLEATLRTKSANVTRSESRRRLANLVAAVDNIYVDSPIPKAMAGLDSLAMLNDAHADVVLGRSSHTRFEFTADDLVTAVNATLEVAGQ